MSTLLIKNMARSGRRRGAHRPRQHLPGVALGHGTERPPPAAPAGAGAGVRGDRRHPNETTDRKSVV